MSNKKQAEIIRLINDLILGSECDDDIIIVNTPIKVFHNSITTNTQSMIVNGTTQ